MAYDNDIYTKRPKCKDVINIGLIIIKQNQYRTSKLDILSRGLIQ